MTIVFLLCLLSSSRTLRTSYVPVLLPRCSPNLLPSSPQSCIHTTTKHVTCTKTCMRIQLFTLHWICVAVRGLCQSSATAARSEKCPMRAQTCLMRSQKGERLQLHICAEGNPKAKQSSPFTIHNIPQPYSMHCTKHVPCVQKTYCNVSQMVIHAWNKHTALHYSTSFFAHARTWVQSQSPSHGSGSYRVQP